MEPNEINLRTFALKQKEYFVKMYISKDFFGFLTNESRTFIYDKEFKNLISILRETNKEIDDFSPSLVIKGDLLYLFTNIYEVQTFKIDNCSNKATLDSSTLINKPLYSYIDEAGNILRSTLINLDENEIVEIQAYENLISAKQRLLESSFFYISN